MFFDPKTKRCYGKLTLQTLEEAEREDKSLERSHMLLSETRELDGEDLELAERVASMHTEEATERLKEMRAKDGRKSVGIPKI